MCPVNASGFHPFQAILTLGHFRRIGRAVVNVIFMGVCESSAAAVAGDVGNTLALVVVVCRLCAEYDTA